MKTFKILARLLAGFGLVMMFVSIVPISAQAAINITSSTLNGGSSVSVAPSATISANVALTSTSGTDWRSTSWNINGGSFTCVDHANHDTSGNYNETFNITALAAAGTYDVIFRAHTNNSCSAGTVTRTMNNAITVVIPLPVLTDATKTIAENSPAGTNVGTVLTATNSPTGYTITGGTGSALFDISAAGQITVKAGAVLDYETTSNYTLLVKATNSGGDSNIATITINLTDVLVPLVTAGQSFSLLTGTANGTVVGTVATTVTTPTDFNITGTTFAISSTGVITVANSTGLVAGSGTYTVGASTSEGGDSKPITIVVTQRSSNLALTNTDSVDPVITNASYTYTLGISNTGPDEATELVLTDTLPVGVTFQSAVGTGWSCTEAGGLVVCTKPNLANGATSNVVITVLAPVIGGMIANSATVISSGTDVDSTNNTDIAQSTTVQAKADLKIIKTGPASAIVNNTIQYTLSVTNLGPSATDNVTVTDVLPVGIGFQITSGNDWICSFTTATRTLSCIHPTTLEVGATSAITLVTTAPATVPSPAGVINTATVTGPLVDDVSGNNTSSVTTTITAASYTSPNVRPFALFRQDNVNGDIQMIGNSVMLVSGTPAACALAGQVNNNLNTVYADRDSDANTTLNSTSADLVLPPKVRSGDIQYAMLYWQGRTTGTAQLVNGKTVKIKPFGAANYQTLTSLDTKFNWSGNDYQGAVEVTNLIKNSLDAVGTATLDSTGYNKPLWVGDVFANKLGSTSNGFGAWSLIIAYKDAAAKLRNISTYDGYDVVASGSPRSATLSGFLTPSSGAVDSKFLVFAGEGDSNYVSDQATLTNKAGTAISVGANTFKSVEDINGVNVTNRNPNCANTIGLDLRTFSVGSTGPIPIIENGQTTTTVAMSSSQDQYFPGAFAFSTELYVPSVCYEDKVTFNGLPISGSNRPLIGNQVEYEVTIKNQDPEEAKGLFVEKVFDTPSELTYAPNSLQIAPIPGTTFSAKSDSAGNDTAEYLSSTAKFLLGSGAAWYQGGTLQQNQQTKFKYKAKVADVNVSDSSYRMSYRNDLLHLTFNGITAPKCYDFNSSFAADTPPSGSFDAWETSLSAGTAKLYTKVAAQNFTISVGTRNENVFNGNVCAQILSQGGTTLSGGNYQCSVFANHSSRPFSWTVLQAEKIAQVQIKTKSGASAGIPADWTGYSDNNSTDLFAIRPSSFGSDLNASPYNYKAELNASIVFRANDGSGSGTQNYNESEGISFSVDVNISDSTKSCHEMNISFSPDINLTNGTNVISGVTPQYSLPNVGSFNVTMYEIPGEEYAHIDADDTPDSDRMIVPYTNQIKVIPDHFRIDGNFTNRSNGFTYQSNFETNVSLDRNISALLDVNITAKTFGDINTATNYTGDCYAQDGNVSLNITLPAILPAASLSKILWYDDLNNTNQGSFILAGAYTPLFYPAIRFVSGDSNGTANIRYRLNFDRNETRVVNPFTMTVNEVNATDTDSVDGNRTLTNNNSAYYVYGRIIPRDIRVFGANTPFTANAWYEVYKAIDINGTSLPVSRNDANWYTNTLHTDLSDGDGDVTVVITGANPANAAAVNGMETYTFSAGYALGGYKAHINTDPWLWYGINASGYLDPVNATNLDCLTHPCFNINIVPAVGATGSAKSTNEATKASKRSDGGTGWHSTTDYSPAIR